jgi:hypothetical protein
MNRAEYVAADDRRGRSLRFKVNAVRDLKYWSALTKTERVVESTEADKATRATQLAKDRKTLDRAKADQARNDAEALFAAHLKGDDGYTLPEDALPALSLIVSEGERGVAASTSATRQAWSEYTVEVGGAKMVEALGKLRDSIIEYVPAANAKHADVSAIVGGHAQEVAAIDRLLTAIVAMNGATKGELGKLRDALKLGTTPMPTIDSIRAKARGDAQNTPAAKRQRAYEEGKAHDQELASASAAAASKARKGTGS